MTMKLKPNQFLLPSGALITEIPLLFSTEMIQANLDGRKTQTRRTKGLELRNENPNDWTRQGARTLKMFPDFNSFDKKINSYPGFEFLKVNGQEEGKTQITRPRFTPGDLLWFRETWLKYPDGGFAFKASTDAESEDLRKDYVKAGRDWSKWKPSIHMPKAASRIWAMVEEIRVERVQDISEEDAIAEGIKRETFPPTGEQCFYFYPCKDLRDDSYLDCPKTSFYSLWKSINDQASWDSNPWVWVIHYRILSTTGRPSMELIEDHYRQVTAHRSPLTAY